MNNQNNYNGNQNPYQMPNNNLNNPNMINNNIQQDLNNQNINYNNQQQYQNPNSSNMMNTNVSQGLNNQNINYNNQQSQYQGINGQFSNQQAGQSNMNSQMNRQPQSNNMPQNNQQIKQKKNKPVKQKKELGTTPSVLLTMIMMIIIFGCITYMLTSLGYVSINFSKDSNSLNENTNNIDNNSNVNNTTNNNIPTYSGTLLYDTSVNINDKFSIEIPNNFKETANSNQNNIEYEYTSEGENDSDTCVINFGAVAEYANANILITSIVNYNSAIDKVNGVILNSTEWHNFSVENDGEKTYYYAADIDSKVYLLKVSYKSTENPDKFEQYQQSIIESIKTK